MGRRRKKERLGRTHEHNYDGLNIKQAEFLRLLDEGYSIEDAMRELGVGIREVADWYNDERFVEEIERWRQGMALIVEGKLVDAAKKGRTVAAKVFLQSIDPQRWSEKYQLRGDISEERVVKLVFGWTPNDMLAMRGSSMLGLPSGKVEGEVVDVTDVRAEKADVS